MDPEPFTPQDEQDEQHEHGRAQFERRPHGRGHHKGWSRGDHGHGHGPHGGRLGLPLAALGIAGLARARQAHGGHGHGPHFGAAAALPMMALGIAGMALAGGDHGRGGFRGGPFHEGRGPFGGNPFGGRGPFGGFPFGGPGGPFGGGPRAKRGDVRSGILALLAEEPRNGYQIIQELAQRSGGAWRPSSGAVYPALQQMEDEGLIVAEERDGKRTFALTEAGRLAYAATNPEGSEAPWESLRDALRGGMREEWQTVGGLIQEVAMAAMQVVRTGNSAQVAQAATQLKNTRRALYRILAEDAPADTEDTANGAGRA